MTKVLTLEQVSKIPVNELLALHEQGYRLECKTCGDRGKGAGFGLGVKTLATGCGNITQGTSHSIAVNASGGVSPYIYKLYIGGVVAETFPATGTTTVLSHTFTHIFNEPIGLLAVKGEVLDSCTPTAQVMSDSCNVTIVSPPCPALTATMTIT